jgi:hypothetical protein
VIAAGPAACRWRLDTSSSGTPGARGWARGVLVSLTTVAVSKVRDTDAGLASALLNVGQQVGGSTGLSVSRRVAATPARNVTANKVAELAAHVKAGQLPNTVLDDYAQLAAAQQGVKASPAALHDNVAVNAVAEVQAHAGEHGLWSPRRYSPPSRSSSPWCSSREEDRPAHV